MHQTRAEASTRLPIPRKGTKYLARARGDLNETVSVVAAVRDMLKLAKTAKEVRHMINEKKLKINGREVKDYRESISLFSVFEADKTYYLTILPTGRFTFEETNSKDKICKVVNKTLLKKNKIQLNLHDGSNILSNEKIKTNDTVYISFDKKITKIVSIEKGKDCFIFRGKYAGNKGKIESVKENLVTIKIQDKTVELNKKFVMAL